MRPGVRIGIDPGEVRVGVARSDPDGILAVPVCTVNRGPGDLDAIGRLVREHEAIEVLIGYPVGLSGLPGRSAERAAEFARRLATCLEPIPVRLVDERLTTVVAQRGLRDAGRKKNHARKVVDQAAAVSILQHALEAERSTGIPAGTTVGTT